MRDIKYIRRVGAGVYFYIATVTVKSRPKARVTLVSILIRPECVSDCLFVRGKFPGSLIKKTVRVTGLVFSVKCRYNPDETKW